MKVLESILFCATLSVLGASAPVAEAQVWVVSARPITEPLSSAASTGITAVIRTSSATPRILHVFVEEYPSGSGCAGNQHRTNGGRDFQVGVGVWTRTFVVPWFGHQTPVGFLQIGARFDNEDPAYWSQCLTFAAERPPSHANAPPSNPRPPRPNPPAPQRID
jgi:hypothetical protein